MPDEIEDDVPVYVSGADDSIDLTENVDKKALLEDEPPIEWSRYKPEKTLEEAAEEAEQKGEVKIKGRSNKDPNNEPSAPDKSVNPFIESMQKAESSSSVLQTATSKLRAMRNKLGIANRKEVDLSQFSSTAGAEDSSSAGVTASHPGAKPPVNKLLIILTAVNVFALGIWCGSFLFPSNRMQTSLVEEDKALNNPKLSGKSKLMGDTTFSNIVEKLSPSVVNIDTRYVRRNQNKKLSVDYGGSNQDQASGLIISSNGHILTNNHVIPRNTQIRVTLFDSREFPAKVVGRDSYTDLAVIKIDAKNLPIAKFGQIHKMHSGDWAIVIGSPYGLDHSVSLGVISALDRKVVDFNHHVPFIQTDAAINPGNSGGPLVNIDGEVIGIATGAVRSGSRGIAFAIPIDVANRVAKKIVRFGAVARPYLGIYMKNIDPNRKKARSLPSNPVNVQIGKVVPGGPADICGLRRGDIILKVNGSVVNSADEVRAFIKTSSPGDILKMSLQRGVNIVEKNVKLGLYPENM